VEPITFIIPVGDDRVFEQCIAASPLLQDGRFEVLAQRGYPSASAAFNAGIDRARSDVLVFCHQDILFPARWDQVFLDSLSCLRGMERNVGVVGCLGITNDGVVAGHVYRHDRELLLPTPLPHLVRTLDEMLICFHRATGLRFDENLPSFFYYAVDICLQAEKKGLVNFVVDAPCFHQAKNRVGLPYDFYRAQNYMVRKWRERLPVHTPSGLLHNGVLRRVRALKNRLLLKWGLRKPWWAELPQFDATEILRRQQGHGKSL